MLFKVIKNIFISLTQGIAVDTNGDVYMTHPNNNKLTKIAITGGTYGAATEITLSETQFKYKLREA